MTSNNMKTLVTYHVELPKEHRPNDIFPLTFFGNSVVTAPAFYKWMVGKYLVRIKEWVASKEGTFTKIENDEPKRRSDTKGTITPESK